MLVWLFGRGGEVVGILAGSLTAGLFGYGLLGIASAPVPG